MRSTISSTEEAFVRTGYQLWAAVHQVLGDGSGSEVSLEEEETVYAKTQRPETTQSCHDNTSSSGGVQGSVCGVGDVGEQKMRLKRNTAKVLSRGNGELLEDFQQRKGFQ